MSEPKKRGTRWLLLACAGSALTFGAIQLVPVHGIGSNPPVTAEPAWDSPRTRELFARTCGDCHSNETRWPWYSHVAPVSWLLARDVREGREHLNVSEWNRPQHDTDEAAEQFSRGEMPPWFYLPAHPEARLTEAERAALLAGLEATFGKEGNEGGRGEGHGHEDED